MLVQCGCYAPRYHYDVRTDLSVWFTNADAVIEAVRNGLRERSPKITVTYTHENDNMADIPAVIGEIMRYAMAETDDPREGDYIYHQYGGYELGFTRSEGSGGTYSYEVTIVPEYYTDPSQEAEVDRRVADIIAELELHDKTDEQKVKAVYDYVYENVKYDRVHKNKKHYHLKTTAYAALVNGCAVCQGFSVLMYRLLREAGINARVVTGNAVTERGREYHAWNIAEIDGVYRNIDVTWDVQTGTHEMYLLCDEEFSQTHEAE